MEGVKAGWGMGNEEAGWGASRTKLTFAIQGS